MPIFGVNQQDGSLPVKQVREMRAQGLDNNQIIQTLQREGFNSTDIFDALNQADMPVPQESQSSTQNTGQRVDRSDVGNEELIEAMIDEKWNDLMNDINQVIEWKKQAESKLNGMEQQFNNLKQEFDKVHHALISKVEQYDNNITQVGADVKAMEQVFSKVLPMFTENVKELSRIANDMKKKK